MKILDGILEVENWFICTVAELKNPREGYKAYIYGDGLLDGGSGY